MKVTTALLATALTASSQAAPDVYFVAGAQDYSELVRFAVWSWNERAGFNATWSGLLPSSTDHCTTPGSIIFRTASDHEEFPQLQFTPEVIARTISCQAGGMWVAAFNPKFPLPPTRLRSAVLHELGHALAADGHTPNIYSVMHATRDASTSEYLLTTTDALFAQGSTHWPRTHAPSLCHIELAPDLDLLIPELPGADPNYPQRATLNYAGIVDGYHTWDALYVSDAPQPQGCTNVQRLPDGKFQLSDIRSLGGNYASATLQVWQGRVRLLQVTK